MLAGTIVITIPSDVSQLVVRRSLTVARQGRAPVLGLVENMSMFTCPDCGHVFHIEFWPNQTLSPEETPEPPI